MAQSADDFPVNAFDAEGLGEEVSKDLELLLWELRDKLLGGEELRRQHYKDDPEDAIAMFRRCDCPGCKRMLEEIEGGSEGEPAVEQPDDQS